MAACFSLYYGQNHEQLNCHTRGHPSQSRQVLRSRTCCFAGITASLNVDLSPSHATISGDPFSTLEAIRNTKVDIQTTSEATSYLIQRWMLADLDPANAKLAIVMSWYPKLPVGKFPYVLAYAPTEPLLTPTRKLIPPLGGLDVTPVAPGGKTYIQFCNARLHTCKLAAKAEFVYLFKKQVVVIIDDQFVHSFNQQMMRLIDDKMRLKL
ncbi:unnamed protein product [Dovyalis caffra]|uniref:Uncharacterized protein n=1 Tax=Dovyalis caffra TaxID=77055 RepID=A0AAV1S9X2_9ROSI|nr:unnamed protein product [Dovyalis caffra]